MSGKQKFKVTPIAAAVSSALLIGTTGPAFAQDEALEEITVTGIRGSLQNSMTIKRDTTGIVDAISSEDIGKFPDTNLAESLQRITGISIERRDGEGAQVTARGFGPQFNMFTLNGRQIPGADALRQRRSRSIGGTAAGTRAFNFAQLSSDAIAGITVYKTGQASVPSGGIGATIDILTDRPFNHDGMVVQCRRQGRFRRIAAVRQRCNARIVRHLQLHQRRQDLGRRPQRQLPEAQRRLGAGDRERLEHPALDRHDPALRPDAVVQCAGHRRAVRACRMTCAMHSRNSSANA